MSDNTLTRAMLACEHGNFDCRKVIEWPLNTATNANDFIPRLCPGGREIVLIKTPWPKHERCWSLEVPEVSTERSGI